MEFLYQTQEAQPHQQKSKQLKKMYMKKMLSQAGNLAGYAFVGFVMCWVCFALSFQLYFVTGMALGQDAKLRTVEDELTVRIDGRYTHDPRNWGYEGPEN